MLSGGSFSSLFGGRVGFTDLGSTFAPPVIHNIESISAFDA